MIMTHSKSVIAARNAAVRDNESLVPETGTYHIHCTYDHSDVERLVADTGAEYIVMGAILPAQSGVELCRLMQGEGGVMPYPVMVMSEAEALHAGLPLSAARREMVAAPVVPARQEVRSSMVVRDEGVISVKDMEIIPGRHEVRVMGEQVDLSATEFKLLRLFAESPGWVHSRDQIIEALRGPGYSCTPRSVDVLIVGLRRKLGRIGNRIQTVRGVGYRYRE